MLVAQFWVKFVDFRSEWSGLTIPLTPVMCLLGDRSQIPTVPKTFSVIMVGPVTASRAILRHWKTAVSSNLKDWIDAAL